MTSLVREQRVTREQLGREYAERQNEIVHRQTKHDQKLLLGTAHRALCNRQDSTRDPLLNRILELPADTIYISFFN